MAVGSTKAQISRTENLTRDNATIQEVENERNVITPDELIHAEFFESQLLNPLFAHLVGIPQEYLEVRIVMRRIPDKEDILEKLNAGGDKKGDGDGDAKDSKGRQEDLQEEKEEDIAAGALQQEDAQTPLGASGDYIAWYSKLTKHHQNRWRQFHQLSEHIIKLTPTQRGEFPPNLGKLASKEAFDEHKDTDEKTWMLFVDKLINKITTLATARPEPMSDELAAAAGKFNESDHKRDSDGKFSKQAGDKTKDDDNSNKPKDYTDIVNTVRDILKNNQDKEGYSINPKTGNIWDATIPSEAQKMYQELVKANNFDDGKPIHIVGVPQITRADLADVSTLHIQTWQDSHRHLCLDIGVHQTLDSLISMSRIQSK